MKINFYLIMMIMCLGILACEKNLIDKNNQWTLTDGNAANIRIINTWSHIIKGVPTTRFIGFQDNERIMGNGLSAPGVWPASTYAQVKPGRSNILLLQDRKVAATANTPASIAPPQQGDTAIFRAVNLEANKNYSLFLIGDSLTSDFLVIEDKLETLDTNTYALRFTNLVVNSTPQPVRLFSRRENRDLFTNVAYKQVTDFLKLKYTNVVDTLDVFSGTTRLYSINGSPRGRGRIYTIFTNGKTGVRTPTVNWYINR